MRLGVGGERAQVRLVLLEGEVAGVGVADQRRPLLARQGRHGGLAVGALAGALAAVDERAGVARVVQRAQHPPVAQRHPGELALALAAADRGGEQQALVVERLDDGARRAGAREGLEQVAQGVLDAGVGVEHDLAGGVIDQPDGERHLKLAAACLGEDAALQAGADEVQLGLRHRALEPEQQPVVEVAGVIEPVLVADQRARQRADLEQPVPVGVVARQPRDLEPEHDPGPAQADLGDQLLEALAVGRRGAGLALVGVDHDDPLGRPAERDRALAQRVLALGGLGVQGHLAQRRLAHIQERGPREVLGGDLRRGAVCAHRGSPPGQAGQRHRREHADDLLAADRCLDRRPGPLRGRGRDRGLPGACPGGHAAALEQREPQPPPRWLAAERLAAQLLIALDIADVAPRLTPRLRFWVARRA